MKKRYWLSFDLGLHGNYEDLYEWLDQGGAKECGDSVATFLSDKTREEIAQELSQILGPDKKARVYLINLKQGGKFMIGRRKAAPWAGHSPQAVEAEEER